MVNFLVSIVIPIYNAEDYLFECLSSIIKQTYKNWECLLIDDGSSDNSGCICDRFANLDNRIKCIHQKNGGVSIARNSALDVAVGQWVAFIDSDDVVPEDYLQKMVNRIISNNQLIVTGYDIIGGRARIEYENKEIVGNAVISYFFDNHLVDKTMPWAKLFNRELIEKHLIRFPVGVQMGEDAIFLFDYMCYVDRISMLDDTCYHYRLHDGSLVTKINSFESEWKTFRLWKEKLRKLVCGAPLDNDYLFIIWNNGVGKQFTRCLKCIYCKNNKYGFRRQLELLNSIPPFEFYEYYEKYVAKSFKERINKLLVRKRYFATFILFNQIYKNNC